MIDRIEDKKESIKKVLIKEGQLRMEMGLSDLGVIDRINLGKLEEYAKIRKEEGVSMDVIHVLGNQDILFKLI